jgi:hypothetical protein
MTNLERIIEIVDRYDLKRRTRKREIVLPRHYAMYFIKKKTHLTNEEVADIFGLTYTSVSHAKDTVMIAKETKDELFYEYTALLRAELEALNLPDAQDRYNEDQPDTTVTSVYMSRKKYNLFKRIAKLKGMSFSKAVCEMIDEVIERQA